uniref:Phosphatase and actin regulator n=1 Tax=Mola mola TaxID=94237 RepID=A0A3Q3VQD4_MOLML
FTALKSPAAFHGQIRSLERARTENFLKHKIRSRPERAELVRMHILQETGAEPSLQATQMRLKRARLADNLNEKIAQRPGPMELVEKNILPVDSNLKQAIIGEKKKKENNEGEKLGFVVDFQWTVVMHCPQSSQQVRSPRVQSPLRWRAKRWKHPRQAQLHQQCPAQCCRSDTDIICSLVAPDFCGFITLILEI